MASAEKSPLSLSAEEPWERDQKGQLQSADLMVQRGGSDSSEKDVPGLASGYSITPLTPTCTEAYTGSASTLAPDITHDLEKAGPFPEVGEVWQDLEPGSRNE